MREPDDDASSSPYSRQVGQRLRAVRRQLRLSLQEVEANSAEEFKASVLGAYERGERAISVPRLERLASFYGVAIGELLPREDASTSTDSLPRHLVIDLVRLQQSNDPEVAVLARFVRTVLALRHDDGTEAVSLRASDNAALAAMCSVPVEQLADRLAALGVLHEP